MIGRDDNAILIGQVFERSSSAGAQNEIIAEAVIRVRFLRGGGGTVPPKEIRQLLERVTPCPNWSRGSRCGTETRYKAHLALRSVRATTLLLARSTTFQATRRVNLRRRAPPFRSRQALSTRETS